MIRLRLYSSAEPSRQIDQRMVGEDLVTIGRDASADWVISDPDRALSRRHCTVQVVGSAVAIRDTSANGTFLGDATDRIAPSEPTLVNPGESFRIGTFTLLVEALAADAASPHEPPPRSGPSMFAPPAGLEPSRLPSTPASLDPFASKLVPDPLLADHRPGDRVSLGDGDAWDRRPAARAGDWDLPRDRPDHDKLIGAPRDWAESPPVELDAGFGFDAPFDRPGIAPPAPAPVGVIPADWETAAPVETPPSQTGSNTSPPAVAVVPPAHLPSSASPPEAMPPLPGLPTPADIASAPPVPQSDVDAPSAPDVELASPLALRPGAAASPAPVTVAPPLAAPPTSVVAAPSVSVALPTATPSAASPTPTSPDDDLFEAFCAGAQLPPTSFAPADRAAAMRRLGEVYRSMVLGLADLMGERTALKSEYRLARTMVRPDRNNPFKWAPPQRLALEVLRGGELGFADGAEAVTESFRDVKSHILGVLAGMRGAVTAAATALSPTVVEAAADGRSFLIKAQRDAALWVDYVERFERFRAEAEDSADGAVNRAFRMAYEKQLAQLDASAVGSADDQSGPR